MCPSVLDSISSCIGSASTEITSLIAPTCILKFKVAVSVILTRTCSMVAVLNPLRVASTLYEPGGSNGTMYRPSPCVAVVLTCPVAVLNLVTSLRQEGTTFTPHGAHCQLKTPSGAFLVDTHPALVLQEWPVSTGMRVEQIILREIRMRLKAPFETSFGVTQDRRILLVEAVVDGVSGWGEVTTVESPSYNSETTETAWHVISDFIAPRIIGRDLNKAADAASLLSPIRGHQMAKAGVENALWDAE